MDDARWLLPVGIEELLPDQAWELERLRRALLDLYRSWGYELVVPPFVDSLDSLLTGTGRDLDAQTFKLIDPLSGRLLGIRADMTPQVARIDAHRLRGEGPTRLCYLGTVLHTRSDGFAGTRSPFQIGAEIYGHDGAESEIEILRLVLLTLATAGIVAPYLDLGHVGIYRGLARQAGLNREQELALFDIVQRKAASELNETIARFGLAPPLGDMLLGLIELNGDDALERAARILAPAADSVHRALAHLHRVAAQLRDPHVLLFASDHGLVVDVLDAPPRSTADVVRQVVDAFALPTFAFQVSGEYAMVKAAAERGWLDGVACMEECLLAFKRAGADAIVTYAALEVAERLARRR